MIHRTRSPRRRQRGRLGARVPARSACVRCAAHHFLPHPVNLNLTAEMVLLSARDQRRSTTFASHHTSRQSSATTRSPISTLSPSPIVAELLLRTPRSGANLSASTLAGMFMQARHWPTARPRPPAPPPAFSSMPVPAFEPIVRRTEPREAPPEHRCCQRRRRRRPRARARARRPRPSRRRPWPWFRRLSGLCAALPFRGAREV